MVAPHPPHIPDPRSTGELAARKAALRREAVARRAGLGRAGVGEALAAHLLAALPPPAGAVVAGYWPMGDEIDPRPLLLRLAERGHPLALPVTPARGLPLRFRAWSPGGALLPGRFGTAEPPPDSPERVPDFLLVPLLAFDRRGNRLGYGAGYYDRTLSALAGATALGVAFSLQEVPLVPVGAGDVALDAVVTERGLILPESAD